MTLDLVPASACAGIMNVPRDQHFLVDPAAVERIAGLVEVCDRRVLEIGPGEGVLTRAHLDRGAHVIAIEIDRDLCDDLADQFDREIACGQLELIHGDAVRVPLPSFEMAVSNLPYSASSKITFRMLDAGFAEAVLMYQLEFAKRMVAPVGTPDCGRLSVMVQTFCCVRICFELQPNVFRPRPQVRSAVVHLIPRDPIFPIPDRARYADVVRALFTHRRKTVRNCLKTTDILGPDLVARMLSSLPEEVLSSRPEELYLEDFATIANIGSDDTARKAGL